MIILFLFLNLNSKKPNFANFLIIIYFCSFNLYIFLLNFDNYFLILNLFFLNLHIHGFSNFLVYLLIKIDFYSFKILFICRNWRCFRYHQKSYFVIIKFDIKITLIYILASFYSFFNSQFTNLRVIPLFFCYFQFHSILCYRILN